MSQIQRNDPCPCGSGKKYKKCCLGKRKVNFSTTKSWTKDKNVYFALFAIFALSIFLRYYGFQQPHGLTFDEGIYSGVLARQLQEDPTNYSTQRAYEVIKATGRYTPEYLNRPLFKHPPLYSYLIALFYKFFGISDLTAVSVSIWLGCLMVLTVFFLGKVLYDNRVGILAAFYVCIDPVHWVCSERIWMETTLSFFILLAVFLFALGLKQKYCLPLCGISIGLAMVTKYPGILPLFIIFSFTVLKNRSLLKQKSFWLLCLMPFLVFLPWIIWNWRVYGNLFESVISVHDLNSAIGHYVQSLLERKWLLIIILFGGGIAALMRNKITRKLKKVMQNLCLLVFAFAFITIPFLRGMITEAFAWKDTILTGWSNPFTGEPWHFYLTRLNELSPVYLFSFLSLFLIFKKNKGDWLLLLSSIWTLGAFILLRNYQSRYILPAVPFLIILSARFQIWAYDKLSQKREEATKISSLETLKRFSKIALICVGVYFVIQTLRTDWLIAIGPDFGYF